MKLYRQCTFSPFLFRCKFNERNVYRDTVTVSFRYLLLIKGELPYTKFGTPHLVIVI